MRFPRGALPVLGAIAVGFAGAWLAVLLGGRLDYKVGPFSVEYFARPGRPATEIVLPPFGRIIADTHVSPVRLTATLERVDPVGLQGIVREEGVRPVLAEVRREAMEALRAHVPSVIAIATIGALAAGILVFRRQIRRVAVATGAGTGITALLMATSVLGFDASAFREPEYTGSLRLAVTFIGPVDEAGGKFEEFRSELNRVTRGALSAYGVITSSPSTTGEALAVLHVSDLHGSPVGMDFALGLARGFDVDLVIDTGDITSFGTPLERDIIATIPDFGVPYLFTRGNHDSPAVAEEIEALGNAQVLEGTEVEIGGLTVYGTSHPLYTPDPGFDLSHEEIDATVRAAGAELEAEIAALPEPPDIVAVHDDRMADAIAGTVPLVVSGHFHQPAESVIDGTIFLRSGTTGGGGIDAFVNEEPVPLAAQILYLDGDPPVLVAYDEVALTPITRDLVVDRRLSPEGALSSEQQG